MTLLDAAIKAVILGVVTDELRKAVATALKSKSGTKPCMVCKSQMTMSSSEYKRRKERNASGIVTCSPSCAGKAKGKK